ncbi:hypothetical protein Tco_0839752 [Tanacetum coccineum]|uniref:Uncharacterized protein n=1 Tax=Tanacetum coccineum TaxID=301880 RepID=A0ABQ5ARI9_9ASTR
MVVVDWFSGRPPDIIITSTGSLILLFLTASDTESDLSEDLSLNRIPPLSAILPFLSSADDTTDSDTPPSLTHGPLHMLTARKRVRPLATHRLAVRHYVDHSSSDYFSPDDSARDSSLDSLLEALDPFTSRGIDVRVVAKTVVRDEVGTDTRDIVEGGDDKVTHLVMPDDVQEVARMIREDEQHAGFSTGVLSRPRGAWCRRRFIYDHTVAIPVHSSVTQEEIEDLVSHRVAEEMKAREAAMNLEPIERYGYIKNHMKTVKNGQARTQERKSEQKPEAKARKSQIFSQLQSILVKQKSTTKDKTQNVSK